MAEFLINTAENVFSLLEKFLNFFGVQINTGVLIPVTVVLGAWVIISVLILSVTLILDMQENRSGLCFVAVCTSVSLAVLETAMTVIFFPYAMISPLVNVLFIAYSVIALVHIRGRKSPFCRIAAVSVIIFEILDLLFTVLFFVGMTKLG